MFGKGLRGLLCAAAVLYAFSGQTRAEEPGITQDSITIGAFGPITGPAAYIGLAGRDGANLAIKEINAAGGINGRKLSMVFEDDGHSPTKALAAVKKLIDQDHVFMIFCVAGSNGTLGTIDFVRENGRVMYVSFASAPGVTWPFARNMFRGGTTEVPRYGELYAEYPARLSEGDEDRDSQRSRGISEERRRRTHRAVEELVSGRAGQARRVQHRRQGFHAAAPGYPGRRSAGDRDLRQSGGGRHRHASGQGTRDEPPFFLGTTMVDQSLLNVAKQAAEGASGFALLPLLPSSSNPEMKSWVAKWKQEYPNLPAGRPNVFDVLSYSDMYVVADALKRAGKDLTTDKFIDALEATHDYRVGTIASPITFTRKHHIGNLRLQAMQVKNGEWQPVAFEGKRESDILKRYQ